jgi:hypothetical protein
MMRSRKRQVLKAIHDRDREALDALGWTLFANYMKSVGAQAFGWKDLEPFAVTYGDDDPEALLDAAVEAVRSGSTNGFRPKVSQLGPWIKRDRPDPDGSLRPEQKTEALKAVRRLIASNTEVCDCRPATITFSRDHEGVLRCADCLKLEPGQVDTALEAA